MKNLKRFPKEAKEVGKKPTAKGAARRSAKVKETREDTLGLFLVRAVGRGMVEPITAAEIEESLKDTEPLPAEITDALAKLDAIEDISPEAKWRRLRQLFWKEPLYRGINPYLGKKGPKKTRRSSTSSSPSEHP